MPVSCNHDMMPSTNRSWTAILAVAVCFVCHALAAAADAPSPAETLLVDNKSPYPSENGGWIMLSPADAADWELRKLRLRKRADESGTAKQSVTTTFSIVVGKPTATATASNPPSALPTILDSLSSNFTPGPNGEPASCPKFINSFISSQEFKECYPLSMLFDNSRSFFDAQKSLVSITRTLDATCAANVTACSAYMGRLAQDFTAPENCGPDWERGNSAVVAAHKAMLAYAPVYGAGCLRDPETSAYCYANAITNSTTGNTYIYFLPFNKTLPGSTVPSCSYCTQQTMNLFQVATGDRRQLIANTYTSAAKQVNLVCGPNFVNETLAAEVIPNSSGARNRGLESSTLLATSVSLMVAFMWLT